MSTIASLSAQLSLNSSAFARGLAKAASDLDRFNSKAAKKSRVNLGAPKAPSLPSMPTVAPNLGRMPGWQTDKPFIPISQTLAKGAQPLPVQPIAAAARLRMAEAPAVQMGAGTRGGLLGMPTRSRRDTLSAGLGSLANPLGQTPAIDSAAAAMGRAGKAAAAAGKAAAAAGNAGNAGAAAMGKLGGATGKVGDALGKVGKTVKGVGFEFSQMGNVAGSALGFSEAGLMGLSRAALTASLAIAAVTAAIQGLKMAATTETATVSFETITGSAKEAANIVKRIKDMAALTPYTSPELIQSGRHLMAMGVQSKDLMGTLTALGNIASVSGGDLAGLAEAYGKAAARGEVNGRTLEQFARRGVNLREAIAKVFSVTSLEAEKMVTEGKVGFNEFRAAIETLVNEGGRFNAGMLRASQTIEGLGSTIYDNLILTLEYASAAFIKTFNMHDVMKSLVLFTNWMQEGIGVVTTFLLRFTALRGVGAIFDIISYAGEATVAVMREFKPEIDAIRGYLAGLGASFQEYLLDRLPTIREMLLTTFETGGVVVGYFIDIVKVVGKALYNNVIQPMMDVGKQFLTTAAAAAAAAASVAVDPATAATLKATAITLAKMGAEFGTSISASIKAMDAALKTLGIGETADRVRSAFRDIREGIELTNKSMKEHITLGRSAGDILRNFGETAKRIQGFDVSGLGNLDVFRLRMREMKAELEKANIQVPDTDLFKISSKPFEGTKILAGRELAKELQKELDNRRQEFMKIRFPFMLDINKEIEATRKELLDLDQAAVGNPDLKNTVASIREQLQVMEELSKKKNPMSQDAILEQTSKLSEQLNKIKGLIGRDPGKIPLLKSIEQQLERTRNKFAGIDQEFRREQAPLIKQIELMEKLGAITEPVAKALQEAMEGMRFKILEDSLTPMDKFLSRFESLQTALQMKVLKPDEFKKGLKLLGEEFSKNADQDGNVDLIGKSISEKTLARAEEMRLAFLELAKAGKLGGINTHELKNFQAPIATLKSFKEHLKDLFPEAQTVGFIRLLWGLQDAIASLEAAAIPKIKEFAGKVLEDQITPFKKFMAQAENLKTAFDTRVEGKPLLSQEQFDIGLGEAGADLLKAIKPPNKKLVAEALEFGSREEASFRSQAVAQATVAGMSVEQRILNALEEQKRIQTEQLTEAKEVRRVLQKLGVR